MYSHSHGILQEYINQGHKKIRNLYLCQMLYLYIYILFAYVSRGSRIHLHKRELL